MARDRRERGIALLIVTWIFMILGVLALDFSRYMRDDAMAAVNLAEETRGYYIALAGMNRAIFEATRARAEEGTLSGRTAQAQGQGPHVGLSDDDDDDELTVPPDGQWHEGDFAGGRWRVRMADESGRIALNKAEEPLLTRVVSVLMQGGKPVQGMDQRAATAAATVVDSILDWRDHDTDMVRPHGAENDYYMKLRPPYRAKNGMFDSLEELLLVRGVTPELFYGTDGVPGLKDIFSVYGRTGKINPDTAPLPVLIALLGSDAAADVTSQRDGGVPIADLIRAQLAPLGLDELIETEPPRVVRIEAQADVAEERNRSSVAAVVDLASEGGEGTRVLRWLDRAPWDGPYPGRRPPEGA
jgi:type II secretory pathway component PulK